MPDWVRHGIFWQVYPLGFCGADIRPSGPAQLHGRGLEAIVPWLDYALELGVSGLLLGPMFASATHGYDTLDHMRMDVRLGGDQAFDALAEACRERGLRLVLDGVFNHVGRAHPAVAAAVEEMEGRLSPAENPWHGLVRTVGRGADGAPELNVFEGHADLVELDHESPRTCDYVASVMNHWLDRGTGRRRPVPRLTRRGRGTPHGGDVIRDGTHDGMPLDA